MSNPLLHPWALPLQLPPFDEVQDSDFAPAFEIALAEARAAIKRSFEIKEYQPQ